MKIGLDIDGTISAQPDYYADLSKRVSDAGGVVVIISSRIDTAETRQFTNSQLKDWSIRYKKLFLFKPFEEVEQLCPYPDLDWYQRYLWQKVHHAKNETLDAFYDDDDYIINLFMDYAPGIQIHDAKEVNYDEVISPYRRY